MLFITPNIISPSDKEWTPKRAFSFVSFYTPDYTTYNQPVKYLICQVLPSSNLNMYISQAGVEYII